jgi:hypothetical protein
MARGEDPERIYPSFVFRLLTLPTVSGAPTPREASRARWDGWIDEAEADRSLLEALLFGPGGTYDVRTAALRQALLEDLESTLDALARHVDLLERALAQALARPTR